MTKNAKKPPPVVTQSADASGFGLFDSDTKLCGCGCGQRFEPSRPWSKYVNGHAKRAANKRAKKMRQARNAAFWRNDSVCAAGDACANGGEVMSHRDTDRPRKYCGPACRMAAMRRRRKPRTAQYRPNYTVQIRNGTMAGSGKYKLRPAPEPREPRPPTEEEKRQAAIDAAIRRAGVRLT